MSAMPLSEIIAIVLPLLGAIGGLFAFVWRKLIKPANGFLKDHEKIKASIQTIKEEVITNGGRSLKDAVVCLKATCERIEDRQKVINQRSKASLHYQNEALFETDEDGKLIWINDKFYQVTGETLTNMEGYNWVTIIDEPEREGFLKEFLSCIEMCRKVDIETTSMSGKTIRFVGYPYKITDKAHQGFLVHLSF
jgi:PAS domain S-box-containing protein